MRIIGLNGRLRSGKDTAYEVITRALPEQNVKRVGFADKLKMSAALALGYDPRDVDEAVQICNQIKDNGSVQSCIGAHDGLSISGREFLQRYGTESHRNVFGDMFWVDALLPLPEFDAFDATQHNNQNNLTKLFPYVDVLVVTDVRFDNEASRIVSLGGDVWYINAAKRLGPLPHDAHPSEHGVKNTLVTQMIDNNGTVEDFTANIVAAL